MATVNLDALIQREDFDIKEPKQEVTARYNIDINALRKDDFFFSVLRKPDFQRETNDWDAEKICDLINSFLQGDLIPAIILWRSASGLIFIIDGSHRLSSLASWINDDYGDGDISKTFYEGLIPEKQQSVAQRTRNLINKNIGMFKDYQLATTRPEKVRPDIVERAKHLGALALSLQWVQGDSSKAEASYFKINQQGSPINQAELRVLNARKYPNAIAARAIIRSGKGHKYWSDFSPENQASIQEIAQEVNKMLFSPELENPINTSDLPIGGKLYAAQSLPLVLDFINIVNDSPFTNEALKTEKYKKDLDGAATIEYLSNCRKILRRMTSDSPGSLGLHPLVYFYASNGRHKIASFYAITALLKEFEKKNYYAQFTRVREKFEKLLIKYDYLTQQIVRKYRGAPTSYLFIRDFYLTCMEKLQLNMDIDQVIEETLKEKQFNYLTAAKGEPEIQEKQQDFNKETKSEIFIKEALKNPICCKICHGLVPKNSMTIDHIIPKKDGGKGTLENAQITHPYCNSTYKN